ncbi:hypothetical protein [Mycolicibacterium gadium]|jgi:hypothetical protein|uniref:hypothetical protein n=1 Tax=Mycolicibacterium gadium TaxID=1794 RepID=UPI002FDE7EC7
MSMSPQPVAIDYEPDSTQPQAFVLRRCLTATCDGCHGGLPDQANGHYQTCTAIVAAIKDNAWTLSNEGLHCPQCAAPDDLGDAAQVDIAAVAPSLSWLSEIACTLISCTHCYFHLESDRGEAHFPSMKAATEAALSRGWMFAAHQVWCVPCAARVGAAHTPGPVRATA